jgi:antagonist of KipI
MDVIEVQDGGLLTTVQDLGRYRYQRYGVPVAGASDQFALRVANVLVGNQEGDAGLEITLVGPSLRFLADTVIAITGADLDPRLDDEPVAMWRAIAVRQGGTLSFSRVRDGVRACLAIAGGIDVPQILGSRSTYTRSGLGGLEGRALKPGDRLLAFGEEPVTQVEGRELPREQVPTYEQSHMLRVMLGPQEDAFSQEGIQTFLSATYTVTHQSDRVGYRYQGPQIQHKGGADIVSDGNPFGAVQVTGDGMPIILLADRGTTGGYTKIATVISVDLAYVVQAMSGDTMSFRSVTVEEAHQALRQQEDVIQQLKNAPRI